MNKLSLAFTLTLGLVTASARCSTNLTEVKQQSCQPKAERTLGIIKPEAVEESHVGEIVSLIERNKFKIIGLHMLRLTRKQAERFYDIHKSKPFFNELVDYMTSGPVVAIALEKENAIQDWRTLMGATRPAQANIGTLRYMFGTDITKNAVHGSDSPETATRELKLFFPDL